MRMPWEITREMFLSFEEVEGLLAHVRSRLQRTDAGDSVAAFLDRVIIESLVFSGVRSSELCKLTLADSNIDAAEPHFHVRGQRKEDRTVHIPRHLAELLSTYVVHVRPVLLPEDA